MKTEDSAVFTFLLKNATHSDWKGFKSNKTPFGTSVSPDRNDVLVAFIIKDDPLPVTPIPEKEAVLQSGFGAEYLADKEPIPSASLSLGLIIPEEFDKYELDMWRRGHVPVFRIKD